MNSYDPEALEFNEDEADFPREGFEPYRENLIFLVDAQSTMFQQAVMEDEEFKHDSWFNVAVKVAREVLKTRIIASDNDQIAVILYGTRDTKNDNAFEHVYVFHNLDMPDAQRIRDLEALLGPRFEVDIGSHGTKSPDDLRYALWTASQVLASSSSKASKRILIFSPESNPPGTGPRSSTSRDQILSRAQELHETKVAVELYPMTPPDVPFPMDFWKDVINVQNDEDLVEYEGANAPYRLQKLSSTIRQKAFKKRVLSSTRWVFSDDFEIGVQLYAMLQPATRGVAHWLEAKTNDPVRSETAYICNDTGAVLTDIPKRRFPPPPKSESHQLRFPEVIIHVDELQQLKAVKPPGLRLLGFKTLACLKDYHQVRNSTFVYPDERSLQGSTAVFVAFHRLMLEQDKIAICRFVRTKSSEPRLVALLPQQEVYYEDGTQAEPGGFHMIYLPYADDIRAPESDPAFVGFTHPAASDEQTDIAEKLVTQLDLQEYNTLSLPNPHLQRHYQVLEAFALNEAPPEEIKDETLPDAEGMEAMKGLILEFKEAVYGKDYDETDAKAKPAASKKRKAAETGPNLAEEVSDIDFKGLAGKGQLGKLTVADLKKYCEMYSLPKSGKKADLVERITQHLGA